MSGASWPALVALGAAETRRSWRALLALGILVGLTGATVIGAVTAARRTATAYDRLRAATHIDDARIVSIGPGGPEAVSAIPQVLEVRRASMGIGRIEGANVNYMGVQSLDQRPGELYTPILVRGRAYRDGAADEAVMTEREARQVGIQPGEVVRMKMLTPEEVGQFATGFGQPDGPDVILRITGIVRVPGPAVQNAPILASPAFAIRHPDALRVADISYLRLREGARSIPAVQQAVDRLAAGAPRADSPLPPLELLRPDDADPTIRTTARVLTLGLLLFAAVSGAVGLLSMALAMARYYSGTVADQHIQTALGLTAAERVGARIPGASVTASTALVVCVAGALAVAALDPIGPMGALEPHPGWAPNVIVIVIGAFLTATGTLCLAALVARRAERAHGRRLRIGHRLRFPGAPWLATGMRFALDGGDGRRRTPVRSSLAGVVAGLLGVLACSVFAASRDALVADRARWGWEADLAVLDVTDSLLTRLTGDRRLQDVSVAMVTPVRVGDEDVTGYALTAVKGSLGWKTPSGRMPTGASEVTLGRRLAERLDLGLGDPVMVAAPGGDHRFTVVGVGYGPSLAGDRFGDNLLFTTDGLETVRRGPPDREALVRSRPGTDLPALQDEFSSSLEVVTPEQPSEVSNLAALGRLPTALGACLAVIAAAALSHLLVVTTRRRARELAVLRALGFTPRQAGSSIIAMAVTTAVVGAGSGIVLGIFVGRLVWNAVVGTLGIPAPPNVPVALVVAVAAVTPVASVLIASLPARHSSALHPALLLREE